MTGRLAAAVALVVSTAALCTTGDALDRASVSVNAPARQVLLSAAEAGPRLVAVGERGILILSDDAGRTWRQVGLPVSVTLTAVRFSDPANGVAVGHGGTVLTSTDGGLTWARRLEGRAMARLAMDAARATNDPQVIKNAERLIADGPDKPLLDILVLDAQHFVVVGAYGLAFSTDDGGHHWRSWTERLDNPKGLHLYAIRRAGDVIVIAGEQGLLLRSDDAGKTFHRLQTPYKGSWFTAELTSSRDIVLAGLRGNVWQSIDAGISWAHVPNPMPESITASTRSADGTLLMSNQAGFVLQLERGQLVPVNSAPMPSLNGLLASSRGPLLGLSSRGVVPVKVSHAQGSQK